MLFKKMSQAKVLYSHMKWLAILTKAIINKIIKMSPILAEIEDINIYNISTFTCETKLKG